MRSAMVAALLCALLAAPPAQAAQADPAPEAVAFVAGFADEIFAGMLVQFGMQAPELAEKAEIHGDEAVAKVFQAEITQAVGKYGAEWRRNLALAWTPLMTGEELESLATLGSQSPYLDKYMGLRGTAGGAMQELSAELLQTALEEVVRNTARRMAAQ